MRTSNTLRFTAVLAALAIALVGAVPAETAGGEPGPKEVIQKTVDQVLAVLRQKNLPEKERRSKLEDIVYAHFDFGTMWRLVLGRYRREFTKQQQEDFAREFKAYLANNYGSRLDRYNQEEVETACARGTGPGW
jgi:ABC-type transporter MlaC component